MPHKDINCNERRRGKDKQHERYIRNNGYSSKHIRIKEQNLDKQKLKKK
jgi:hypothetical protein